MASRSRLLIALMFLAAPQVALACPVCFGQSDSPMAQGVNMGIFVMLGVTGGVLAAFASFFIYLIRRGRMFQGGSEAAIGGHDPAPHGHVTQEGTV